MSDLGKKGTKGAEHLSVGKIGEQVVVNFLQSRKFKIIDQNVYIHQVGELDIVAEKDKRIHIIEVKTLRGLKGGSEAATQMHPLDNLTTSKLEKLKRTAILYTKQHHITNWQLDAAAVWYYPETKKAQVQYNENIS